MAQRKWSCTRNRFLGLLFHCKLVKKNIYLITTADLNLSINTEL